MAFLFPQVKARERCSGDGAEHEKTKHIKDLEDTTDVEREMNTYAELAEEVWLCYECVVWCSSTVWLLSSQYERYSYGPT